MTVTLGVNMINRQIILFFSSALWVLSAGMYVAFQDLQNKVSVDSLFASCSGIENTYLHTKDDTI